MSNDEAADKLLHYLRRRFLLAPVIVIGYCDVSTRDCKEYTLASGHGDTIDESYTLLITSIAEAIVMEKEGATVFMVFDRNLKMRRIIDAIIGEWRAWSITEDRHADEGWRLEKK